MERLQLNYRRDLIHRLRAGESERRISRDLRISRITVHRYRELAQRQGFLEPGSTMPEDEAIRAALGECPRPPRIASSVEPYGEVVQQLLDQQVERVAIFQRLRADHGFSGSYSSVRRYVHRLRPPEPRVVVRVQTAPGEEVQVDFGPVGSLYDPVTDRLRPAYAFVATLSCSRHQYAELVFDQPVLDGQSREGADLDRPAPAGPRELGRCSPADRAGQSQGGCGPSAGLRPGAGRSLPPHGPAPWPRDQFHQAPYGPSQGQMWRVGSITCSATSWRARCSRTSWSPTGTWGLGPRDCRNPRAWHHPPASPAAVPQA